MSSRLQEREPGAKKITNYRAGSSFSYLLLRRKEFLSPFHT